MPTQCNTKPLEFEPHGRRRVVADFDGVLATEERSGFYGRGSMCALKGKGQATVGMPSAVCYAQALDMVPIKVLKIIYFL